MLVWQKSMQLVELVYQVSKGFPKEEVYGLTSQIRRASVSIAANIAEGQGRNTSGEFVQFLGISRGSLAELETLIILSGRLGYCGEGETKEMLELCMEIGRMSMGLKRQLIGRQKENHKS